MDSFFISIQGEDNTINIDENEFNSLIKESEILTKYKKLMIYYLTYHEAFLSLKDFIDKNPLKLLEKMSLRNFAIPNSYVGNCLNAFYSFEQFCEHYFDRFQNEITESNGTVLKPLKCDIYDENFEYRLMYNLRTYSTHCEFPIATLHQEFDFKTKSYINPKFCVNTQKMSESSQIQKSFKKEFDKTIKDKEFDVYPYLEKLDLVLAKVVNVLILYDKESIINIYKHYTSYLPSSNSKASVDLWKNSNVELYMTSHLYWTYLNFVEGMKKNKFCQRHPVCEVTINVNSFIHELGSIINYTEK